jgi:hypothetical protein
MGGMVDMVQTTLLKELHGYVDEYITYLSSGIARSTADANAELRQIIEELEDLQTHPDRTAKVAHVSRRIAAQRAWLRRTTEMPHHAARSSAKHTLAQALQDYISSEIDYLARAGGATRRIQTNLLLGDIIADLKALALHPDDHQALLLAADLERKRKQLSKIQPPWQQEMPLTLHTSD